MVISGCIGPRGDGYDPGRRMTAGERPDLSRASRSRHFATTAADMVTALTITNVERSDRHRQGGSTAWRPAGGFRPSPWRPTAACRPARAWRQRSRRSIAKTGSAAAYFMLNCAHPDHFAHLLESGEAWTGAASRDPRECVETQPRRARQAQRRSTTVIRWSSGAATAACVNGTRELTVLGGCCGTDHRHVQQICLSCLAA